MAATRQGSSLARHIGAKVADAGGEFPARIVGKLPVPIVAIVRIGDALFEYLWSSRTPQGFGVEAVKMPIEIYSTAASHSSGWCCLRQIIFSHAPTIKFPVQ